ncbi:hypothetical protein LCGC14_1011380 [marine sediment metagenome]|uniref:RNase NYN domain-containing protein n=1 Tax=marine sediment metagenome TaxID=412755 RepID=A0A0F9R676_9ZZZZ|nr:hypothetical protein [bacterium]
MKNVKSYPNFIEKNFVIDGANVCWHYKNKKNRPQIKNLKLLIYELESMGVKEQNLLVFCDASLRHFIDNQSQYYSLLRKKIIWETPAGIKADEFILNFCLKHENAFIISNDLFKKYWRQLPTKDWIKKKRIGFIIIKDEILLIPMLENVLEVKL